MKNNVNSLTRTIFIKLFIRIAIYTAMIFLLFTFGELYFSRTIWYTTDRFYKLLKFINDNKAMIIIVLWTSGFITISFYYLFKSLEYVGVLINASDELVNNKNERIELPSELNDVEKKMNEIKQTAIKNANKAMENEQRKNDLIVYLAHDIKTPLTSIVGYLSLLNDEEDISNKTKKKYVNITLEKSYRLEQLVNELFDVARYNSENIILEREELNINLMIEQIIDEFYPMLKKQDKRIEFNYTESILFEGDPNKLARVLNNVIKNAISYSLAKSTILVELKAENNNVIINVKNRGKRIPDAKLSKIFDKFYRIDSSRTSSSGGSGLGLAIAKDIVELHKGTISVLSEEEETVFSICLPLKD